MKVHVFDIEWGVNKYDEWLDLPDEFYINTENEGTLIDDIFNEYGEEPLNVQFDIIDDDNSNFLTDIDKMYDFLALTKEEFLFSYSYLTEQEYDNTLRLFNEDRGTHLAYLLREAENLLLEESNGRDITWNLTGEELKDRVCDYVQTLNKDEQKVFQEVASSMAC